MIQANKGAVGGVSMGSTVSYWVCCVCPLSYLFATLWQICLCHKFSWVINWDAGNIQVARGAPNWNSLYLSWVRIFPETCWDFIANIPNIVCLVLFTSIKLIWILFDCSQINSFVFASFIIYEYDSKALQFASLNIISHLNRCASKQMFISFISISVSFSSLLLSLSLRLAASPLPPNSMHTLRGRQHFAFHLDSHSPCYRFVKYYAYALPRPYCHAHTPTSIIQFANFHSNKISVQW